MAHVLVVAPFVTFPGEPGANRFVAIARRLATEHRVTLVTSRFCHFTKLHRQTPPEIEGIEVVLLDEPGYRQNVGPARYFSHAKLCRDFNAWLSQAPEFDLAYSAFPLIETNLILARHLRDRAAPLVIDVQDAWPEAIAGPLSGFASRLGRAVLTPLRLRADRAYRSADALVAVSQTHLERADLRGLPDDHKAVVFIGSDRLYFDALTPPSPPASPLRAVYLGTFAGSYDIETLIRAARLCPGVQIEFIGTGPHEDRLRKLAKAIAAPVIFHGAMPYDKAMEQLSSADIGLNAIRANSMASVTNKLSDYFCAGLPILSSQENPEVRALLAHGGGIDYQAGDCAGLAVVLDTLARDHDRLVRMRTINRAIATKHFLRTTTYEGIASLVTRILAKGKYR